jgi:heme exporter protein B
MIYRQIISLLAKDFNLELKRPYLFNGMLLYMVSTVFVCYLAFEGFIDVKTWNALYWIVLLFAAVNSAGRSFSDEFSHRHLYYYSLAGPASIIMGKMIYNAILLMILSMLGFLAFSIFLGMPEMNKSMFLMAITLGSIGLAFLLSLVAGIASRAEHNFTLMAILSFPIVLPMLLILMNLTQYALNDASWQEAVKPVIALLALQVLVVILALVLFPYLWKE